MADLLPCPSCRRHARSDEPKCPFCGGALEGARAIPGAKKRMSRASAFAFASTMTAMSAVAITGCSSNDSTGTTTPPADAGDSGIDTNMVAAYGGPPDTSYLDTAKSDDTGGSSDSASGDANDAKDTGGVGPAYGLPPYDTGP